MQNKRGLIPSEISSDLKFPLATTVRNLMILRRTKILKSYRIRNKMIYVLSINKLRKFNSIFRLLKDIQF